jgi:hypothetical protein
VVVAVGLVGIALLIPAVVLYRPRSKFCGPVVLLLIGAAVAAWPLARWQLPSPLAAAPQLDEEQAAAILAALHKNIYRAFDYRDEEQVYDALAKSVDGPLLRDLYLEIRRGLVMQEQGGAVSRIREVEILDRRKTAPQPDSRELGRTRLCLSLSMDRRRHGRTLGTHPCSHERIPGELDRRTARQCLEDHRPAVAGRTPSPFRNQLARHVAPIRGIAPVAVARVPRRIAGSHRRQNGLRYHTGGRFNFSHSLDDGLTSPAIMNAMGCPVSFAGSR